jgi:hypothetical protein
MFNSLDQTESEIVPALAALLAENRQKTHSFCYTL